MTNLEKLRSLNPDIKIYTIHDPEFVPYGTPITDVDTSEIVSEGEKILLGGGGGYKASVPEFEKLDIHNVIKDRFFGQMPTQTGFVWGRNNKMNALEWHKNSEINVAVDDIVLLLGKLDEIEDGMYHSDKVKAFYLEKGEMAEVYATSLHFTPCTVKKSGMGAVVGLPLGTNTALDREPTDRFLRNKNKWLIAHYQNTAMTEKGIEGNVLGVNIEINGID
ncbi:MAG: DUF4867 family protein [Clostridia bacterium]|nr:DUF4867 family protein [Clostridia bacterium]